MTATVANASVGAVSSVLLGTYGTVEGSCTDLGATEGALSISYEQEHFDLTAEQWTGITKSFLVREGTTIEFDCVETSLANIRMAMGYPSTALVGSTLSFGGLSSLTEMTLYINLPLLGGGTGKVTIHKCIIQASVSPEFSRGDKALVHFTVKVLQDTSKTAGAQFGTFVVSASDTTPPTVAMTSPAEDGTVVGGASTVLTLTFTEAGTGIDEGSLVAGESVVVTNVTDGTATAEKAVTISYASATKVLTVTPTTVWPASGQKFQILITKAVRDMAGNKMAANFMGHFTTA
jgi:hypothetical protein